jgi:CRP/FNR family transcriptional regulator
MRNKKAGFDFIVKKVPFFACLSDAEFDELRDILIEKTFLRNKVIFLEDDTQNYMYVVLSGRVKVVRIMPNGKEHILAVHTPGDFFGEMALLDGKTSPATVIAADDADIAIISKKDFDGFLMKKNRVLKEMVLVLCSRLRHAWMMQNMIGITSAEERIKTLLKVMAEQHGVKDKRGYLISLRLTHQDIADYTGLSRETVSRILGKFLKDGKIEIANKHNIVLTSFLE